MKKILIFNAHKFERTTFGMTIYTKVNFSKALSLLRMTFHLRTSNNWHYSLKQVSIQSYFFWYQKIVMSCNLVTICMSSQLLPTIILLLNVLQEIFILYNKIFVLLYHFSSFIRYMSSYSVVSTISYSHKDKTY